MAYIVNPSGEVSYIDNKAICIDSIKVKDTNPKDAIGVTKSPLSVIPTQVIHEVGLGMLEGALKYGAKNYRVAGARASVYYDATMRHLNQWWEGEDTDPDSNLSHITKAITSLMVLRDSMLQNNWKDDRPPKAYNQNWMQDYNVKVKNLLEKYPNPVKPYTQISLDSEGI